jgi:hypothetical protein
MDKIFRTYELGTGKDSKPQALQLRIMYSQQHTKGIRILLSKI